MCASFSPLVRRKIILVLSICVWNVKKLRVLLSIINALGESNDFRISVNYDLKISINYNKDFFNSMMSLAAVCMSMVLPI